MAEQDGLVMRAVAAREKQQRPLELRKRMTRSEKLLWTRLRGSRLAGQHFRRQRVIEGFVVDSDCQAATLVLEIDDPIHLRWAAQDLACDAILAGRGLGVLRFTNEQVELHLDTVLDAIRVACETRA